jgi:DNA primase
MDPRQPPPPPSNLSAAELAWRAASLENLELKRCNNSCGFLGVRYKQHERHPYKAWHRDDDGRIYHLGYHAHAETAALEVARKVAALRDAAAPKNIGEQVQQQGLSAPSTRKQQHGQPTEGHTTRAASSAKAGTKRSQPEPPSTETQVTPNQPDERLLEAVRQLKAADGTLTAKQVHERLLSDTELTASLAAVKRLCSLLAKERAAANS